MLRTQLALATIILSTFLLVDATRPATAQPACLIGYVWRDARPGNAVCVIPQSRALAADENAKAVSRREAGSRDGVFFCLQSYVWREALPGDFACVIPAARDRVRQENQLALSRTVGGDPDPRSPGERTLLIGVSNNRHAWDEKTFSSTCGRMASLPGPMAGMVGWGQAEIGWPGDNCFAFVMELAVQFGRTVLDMIPIKFVRRAVLSYDEIEAPLCPLVLTYSYRCWHNGDGNYKA